MGKLIKIVLILGVVIGAIVLWQTYGSSGPQTTAKQPGSGKLEGGVAPQEKYGFASDVGVGP